MSGGMDLILAVTPVPLEVTKLAISMLLNIVIAVQLEQQQKQKASPQKMRVVSVVRKADIIDSKYSK